MQTIESTPTSNANLIYSPTHKPFPNTVMNNLTISEKSVEKSSKFEFLEEKKKNEKELILHMYAFNNENMNSNLSKDGEAEKVVIHSNSLNGKPPKEFHKFSFGKKSNENNDFKLSDDLIGDQQFIISYNNGKKLHILN